ncbi:MAG: hypothetical protein GC157_05140 [Frankiales bacterium]|nr:hypothetical protein [Frankiales bacterium]
MSVDGEDEKLAQAWGEAVSAKDHGRILELLHPELDFRAMTPRRIWEAERPDDVVSAVAAWFDDTDEIVAVEEISTEQVADCARVQYRLRVRNDDGLHLVEQQAYVQERDGRVGYLRVMCSGYRPLEQV